MIEYATTQRRSCFGTKRRGRKIKAWKGDDGKRRIEVRWEPSEERQQARAVESSPACSVGRKEWAGFWLVHA